MGVKKTMDTFFASMQEQSMNGYAGRLVNTPMGPFRWNDVMELWENVNNGMVMNNISFQDSIMMLDYSTIDGGKDIPVVSGGDPNRVLFINFNNETLGSVTFSRSTVGRVLRSNRFLGFTAANIPRFNYYPEGITAGLLIEDTSKNLLTSTNFQNFSAWASNSYLGVDENDDPIEIFLSSVNAVTGITNPTGNTTSIRIAAIGNTVGRHYYYTLDSFSAISGQTFTASLWTKGTPGTTFNRYLGLVCDGNQARAMFDLQNNTYQGYAGSNEFGKITTYINDWKRIEMTWVAPTTGAFTMWVVPHVSFVDPIDTYYADDGNTSGFFITSPQLEINSSASSFINVTGTPGGITRGNDLAYFAGTGFTWFNGSCGTFVFEFDKKTAGHTADNIKTRTVMGMNYATGVTSGFAINYQGNTLFFTRSFDGQQFGSDTLNSGINKIALSYYTDDFGDFVIQRSLNGATPIDQPFVPPLNPISGATFMTLGYKQALVGTTAYDYLDTIVRSVQYWNIGITGSKLQQLST